MSITLSIDKLTSLFQKHNYEIGCIYFTKSKNKKEIKFIEAVCPITRQRSMIYISDRYKMAYSETNTYPSFRIKPIDINSRQIDYLTELLEKNTSPTGLDLVAISSISLSILKADASFYSYNIVFENEDFKGSTEDQEEEPKIKGRFGKIEDIVDEAKNIEASMEKSEESLVLTNETENVKIELEFEDQLIEGDSLRSLEKKPVKDKGKTKSFKNSQTSNVSPSSKNPQNFENFVPQFTKTSENFPTFSAPRIEEKNIVIGIIYISKDLHDFYKNISTIEKEIYDSYVVLNKMEDDLKLVKIDEIAELSQKISKVIKEKVEKYKKDEAVNKKQILILSKVLNQSLTLRQKIDKDKKKFGHLEENLNKTELETKQALNDALCNILKIRDSSAELINTFYSVLEELLSFE